jgi:hypothetical protein
MANEFIGRNGIIALNNSQITGSLSVSNGITGSLFGTASQATSASYTFTASSAISSSYAFTASSAINAFSTSYSQTSSFANTFTVAGTLTAQTLVVTTISSSVEYSSGSNIFGNSLSNTQTLTGSVNITGSLNLYNSNALISGSLTTTGSLSVTGSVFVNSPNATIGQFVGNQNGYVEFSVRNTSTSISASGDIAVYADTGTVLDKYIDMGINNSNLTASYYYGGANFGGALDAYMYSVGGNLRVGNANTSSPSQSLFLFSNPLANPDLTITGSRIGIQKSGSLNATLDVLGNAIITGSLTVTQGITASVFGTASQALSASYLIGGATGTTFPYTGSAQITGSLGVTGSINATNFTGSLFGTASQAISASYAGTASVLLGSVVSASYAYTASSATNAFNAVTASYALAGGSGANPFPYTGSAQITGSLIVTGSQSFLFPLTVLQPSQSAFFISQSISQSAVSGSQVYGVNIQSTFYNTTSSQTQTALRVQATFTGSQTGSNTTNKIVDFGATSVGSQFTVTDQTSGSIYMVNDVSGLPIIEATSNWTVNLWNYPNIILQKTGSRININGTLVVSGSIAGGGTTPTLVTGSGLGTGASGSIRGSNNAGIITFAIGSSTTANAGLGLVTYTSAFPNGSSVVLFSANASGSTMPTSSIFVSGSTTNFTISASAVALRPSVTASWNYIVMGF